MLRIEATLWAAETDADLVKHLCASAARCRVTGRLNTRWKDFSARSLVREAGLKGVVWERTADDTPASLTLSLTARPEAMPAYLALLDGCESLAEWEIYSDSNTHCAAPDDRNGGLNGAADGD